MHHIGIYVCVSGSLAITMLQEYLAVVVWAIQYIYMYVYKYIGVYMYVCMYVCACRLRVYAYYSHLRASLRVDIYVWIRIWSYFSVCLSISPYQHAVCSSMYVGSITKCGKTIRANPCLILCLLVVASLRGIQCKWLSCLGKTMETPSPLSGRLFNAAFISVQFLKYFLGLKLIVHVT